MNTDKKMRMNTDRGFTLMELLIAVSIFSIIVLCLYATFSGGIRIWQRQERGFKYSHSARLALDNMAKELRNAINYSQPEKKEDVEELKALKFSGDDKNLTFITVIGGQIAKVDYLFEEAPDKNGVLKKGLVFQKEGFKEEKEIETVLMDGLDDLAFEYAYKAGEEDAPPAWKNSWGREEVKEEKPKLPIGVRITLTFQTQKQEEGEILKKTVFIPTGTLEEYKGL